ncbi:darcynin family protein [Acidicapsa ligni]|uniref:darcynin family protein n=1 Tax=Acidicapsa ligni TaxID=542300 RepID=UPI0021DF4883|nr:darcynin family protein [Acidicapsa ligni]
MTYQEQSPTPPIALTIFMLVKTTPEWLGFTSDQRISEFKTYVAPILRKYSTNVTLRFYDVEFYSARITDLWMWEATSHQAYEQLVEELRDTPIWDRYFEIVEILPGVENAHAKNDNHSTLTASDQAAA